MVHYQRWCCRWRCFRWEMLSHFPIDEVQTTLCMCGRLLVKGTRKKMHSQREDKNKRGDWEWQGRQWLLIKAFEGGKFVCSTVHNCVRVMFDQATRGQSQQLPSLHKSDQLWWRIPVSNCTVVIVSLAFFISLPSLSTFAFSGICHLLSVYNRNSSATLNNIRKRTCFIQKLSGQRGTATCIFSSFNLIRPFRHGARLTFLLFKSKLIRLFFCLCTH